VQLEGDSEARQFQSGCAATPIGRAASDGQSPLPRYANRTRTDVQVRCLPSVATLPASLKRTMRHGSASGLLSARIGVLARSHDHIRRGLRVDELHVVLVVDFDSHAGCIGRLSVEVRDRLVGQVRPAADSPSAGGRGAMAGRMLKSTVDVLALPVVQVAKA